MYNWIFFFFFLQGFAWKPLIFYSVSPVHFYTGLDKIVVPCIGQVTNEGSIKKSYLRGREGR